MLVSELTDYLEQGFEISGQNIHEQVLTKHRLQAFSPAYFENGKKLFSYSEENCRAARSLLAPHELSSPFISGELPDPDKPSNQVALEDLGRFFSNPAKFLINRRLGIHLDEGPPILEEREPFDIKGLEKYLLEEQLLKRRLTGKKLDGFSVVAKASGQLPPGTVGECLYEDLRRGVEDFIDRTRPYTESEPLKLVEVDISFADFKLIGEIDGLYPENMVRYRYARITAQDRIRAWIYHLALNAIKWNQHPGTSLLVGLDPDRVWAAWEFAPVENSETILKELLEIYRVGLIKPIHFFPKSSWVFVHETLEKKRSPQGALLRTQNTWQGNEYTRGESEDAYYQLCFRNINPVDSEFQKISKKIFGPLLMHQSEIGK